AAYRVDLCCCEPIKRLTQRAIAVVTDVVVGQGQQIESGGSQPGYHARTGGEGVAALSRRSGRRQGRFEVADGDLSGGQPLGEWLERGCRIHPVPCADPAAQDDVTDRRECFY